MITIDIAKSWYPKQDPVHGFDHVLRVYHLAERFALIVGADLEIVHAAALLKDAPRTITNRPNLPVRYCKLKAG
jgi:uncharacterized protein